MLDLFFSTLLPGPDLTRFAFVLGIIVSLYLYDRLHLGTGSIIVPGYLGVLAFQPQLIVITLCAAYIAFWLAHRFVGRFLILPPKSKYTIVIVTSVVSQLALTWLVQLSAFDGTAISDIKIIGYLIPGLIAHEMSRQGPRKAAVNVLVASSIVGIVVIGIVFVTPQFFGQHDLALLRRVSQRYLAFPIVCLPAMLFLSVSMSLVIQGNGSLRTGGYVTSAYVALQCANFVGLFLLLTMAGVTFVIVKYVLMPRTVIFGRRKFAAMLLVGAGVSWTSIVAVDLVTGGRSETLGFSAFSVMSIVVAGLLANDIERVGLQKLAAGLLANVAFVLLGTTFVFALANAGSGDILFATGLGSVLILACVCSEKQIRKWINHARAMASPSQQFATSYSDPTTPR